MKITYYGHACFLVETQGFKLLFDPFITGNPLASDVDVASIKADYILLTHGHIDHVLDAEQIAQKTGAVIISNFEIVQWYIQKGLKGHHMNHGGKCTFDFGTVKFVTAIHSSVLPDGTYGGNPGGFVIWNDECCFYVAGDTALTYDMKLIPQLCPPLSLAVLPIGDNFTMGIEEAILTAEFVECQHIIGCHYNTFPPISIDTEAAVSHFSKENKTLILPLIGSTLSF